MLINLISNALKYAKDGDITISGNFDDHYVYISVADEGPGIAVEDMVHIFDRFYRSKKTSNSVKGTGLGLFLSKAIIEAHDGKIRVDNKTEGHGAVFTFILPVIGENIQNNSKMISLS